MKINKFVITIFFSAVGLFASTALWAQEAKTLFVNMPDSLSPLLTTVNRDESASRESFRQEVGDD